MLNDLATPQDRIGAVTEPVAVRRPRPRVSLLDPKFEYTPSDGGSVVLNTWKRKRIRNGLWRGQEAT